MVEAVYKGERFDLFSSFTRCRIFYGRNRI